MNNKDCLTEQELTLHYYGELDASRCRHLVDCQDCTEQLEALQELAEAAGDQHPRLALDVLYLVLLGIAAFYAAVKFMKRRLIK